MDYARDSTQLWIEVLMRCFVGGPSYECNLYWGNTWPLKIVAWWFWKSSGVCEIVARTNGFRKIALLGSLRTNMDCRSYWGTPLGVTNCGHDKFIPACGLLGGGL